MSNLIEHNADNQNNPTLWDSILVVIKYVAIVIAVYVLARLIAIPFVYEFFTGYLSSGYGLDEVYARPFAIMLTALAAAATPTLLLAAIFGYRTKTVFVWILGSSIIVAAATYFFTGDVYFDRTTGKSQKCYAKTLEGFKFSSTCDYDPKLGVRFQKITPEVVKEIVFWKRNGAMKNIPSVQAGQYFDPLTGESIVWYSQHSDGSMHLFPLPGFDPTTGEVLKPVTKKVINEHSLDGGDTAEVVYEYNSGAILADIELALADGYGGYESSENSRQALKDIWKWYYEQKNTPEMGSSPMRLDRYHPALLWMDAWHSRGPIVQVEKVIKINQYVLVVVSFSTDDRQLDVDEVATILDKNAHNVSFKSRPELPGLHANHDSEYKNEGIVHLTLNPHEAIRVMYFIKDTEPGQMNSGYVRFGPSYALKYGSGM